MNGKRAMLVAATITVVALVAPVMGQGTTSPPALFWGHVRHGVPPHITSYNFGEVQQQAVTAFRLGNTSLMRSGTLKIKLKGSAAFAITYDRCTGKTIGRFLSCWVGISYTPAGPFAVDSAVLTAKGANGGDPATLALSGQGFHPSAPRR